MDLQPQGYEIGPDEYPHGLRCMDCGERLKTGDRYSKRLVGFARDTPIVELVCLSCAILGQEKAG
jgi:hypothetical protein